MKFTIKDFSGYSDTCSTIQAMIKLAGGKEFTISELQAAFPDTSRLAVRVMQYLKPKKLKEYLQEGYPKGRGAEIFCALEDRYESEHEELSERKASLNRKHKEADKLISTLSKAIKNPKELLEKIEELEVDLKLLREYHDVSPACSIMRDFYRNSKRETTGLNPLLQRALNNCIRSQMPFAEDDIEWIYKNCKGGYWFNSSSNGKSRGEEFYNEACVFNTSAAISYEKFFKRVPFIIGTHRMFTGVTFKFEKLYWTVTGWNEKNELTCVGYGNPDFVGVKIHDKKGKKKLRKFSREEWLIARKKCELITSYSFHGRY